MQDCKFVPNKCISCDKFSICSFIEIQKQLKELSEEINTLFSAVNQLSEIVLDSKKGL